MTCELFCNPNLHLELDVLDDYSEELLFLYKNYVLLNPSSKVYKKDFSYWGWDKYSIQRLLKSLTKETGCEIIIYNNLNELNNYLDTNEFKLKQKENLNFITFYDDKGNQSLSLISHIRNSLAHGRFIIKKNKDLYLCMEDINIKKILTMRGVVKYSSLVKLIEKILEGPRE